MYGAASNDAQMSGSNGANVNARSTSPIFHVGEGEGYGGLLLRKPMHRLNSVPNCARVKICLGESADKIAALYARTVEAAKKLKEVPQIPCRDRDRNDLSLCTPSTENVPLSVKDRTCWRPYQLSQETGSVCREFQSSISVPNNVQV